MRPGKQNKIKQKPTKNKQTKNAYRLASLLFTLSRIRFCKQKKRKQNQPKKSI